MSNSRCSSGVRDAVVDRGCDTAEGRALAGAHLDGLAEERRARAPLVESGTALGGAFEPVQLPCQAREQGQPVE